MTSLLCLLHSLYYSDDHDLKDTLWVQEPERQSFRNIKLSVIYHLIRSYLNFFV